MQELTSDTILQSTTDSIGAAVYSVDSAVSVAVEKPPTSLFEGHELQAQEPIKLTEKVDTPTGTVFLVLFLCISILIYSHRSTSGFISGLFKAGFDSNLANQNARVENSQRHQNLIFIQGMAIVSISLFVSGISTTWPNPSDSLYLMVLKMAGIILMILFVKQLLTWGLSTLFDLSGEYRFYRFNLNIFLALSGLSLLPLSLLLFYSPKIPSEWVAYTGLGILAFFYLKGLQRGLGIAISSSSISTLHLFYYLCALEILPVFVLIRIAQGL